MVIRFKYNNSQLLHAEKTLAVADNANAEKQNGIWEKLRGNKSGFLGPEKTLNIWKVEISL